MPEFLFMVLSFAEDSKVQKKQITKKRRTQTFEKIEKQTNAHLKKQFSVYFLMKAKLFF